MNSQEIREAFEIKVVLCWSEDDHKFVAVNLPARQVRLFEEKYDGKLVTNPGAVKALHQAFVQFFKEKGRPPDVVRHTSLPLDDFYYERIGINTITGHQTTNLNVYVRRRRAIFAA